MIQGTAPAKRFASFARVCKSYAAIIVPAFVVLAIVVYANRDLFTIPLIENGDLAANALQVQDAKHFRDLLGNYSRWHFHHPGPFFFYIFGAGEALFYNLLHIVPAPLNGEYLAEIVLSVFCLFLSISIFYTHSKKPLFPPLAVIAAFIFLFVVDTALPSSALVSLWPPYMVIFSFLLLTASAASVAAGKWKHIPILALAAMIMIHAHVAQLLFAVSLTAWAVATAIFREWRAGTFRQAIRFNKSALVAAAAVVAIFLLPVALDWALDHPNNIHQIRLYMREHHGAHNSVRNSLLYAFSFFSFDVNPETVLASPGAKLSDLLVSSSYVHLYWSAFWFIALLATALQIVRRRKLPVFVSCLLIEIPFILLLFVYWAWKITGPMYNFNGFFFFSIQLLALLALASLIADSIEIELGRKAQTLLACLCAMPLLLFGGVKNASPGDPDVAPIIAALRERHISKIKITMPQIKETMIPGAGLASYWTRLGLNFCVGPEWDYVFGFQRVCKDINGCYQVHLSASPQPCRTPCSIVYHRPGLYVAAAPVPAVLSEPAIVDANDDTHQSSGFNETEGDAAWTTKKASMEFYLSRMNPPPKSWTLVVTGTTLASRPATIIMNGSSVGVISEVGHVTRTFPVKASEVTFSGPDTVQILVPAAGPVGADPRQLGFLFEHLELRPDTPGTQPGASEPH